MGLFKRFFGKQPSENSVQIESENEMDGSKGNIILEFQRSIKESIDWNELEDVEFAMWLPCEEDKQFAKSPITDKWTEIYSITKLYWSYIAADILKTLGEIDEETFRIGLPENFQAFAFLTVEDEQIVFSVSQEKGIRLHFAKTTPFEYRLLFMDHFLSYCKAWKDLIEQNNGEQDDDLEFDRWWALTIKTSKTIEEKEQLTGVGKIVK